MEESKILNLKSSEENIDLNSQPQSPMDSIKFDKKEC